MVYYLCCIIAYEQKAIVLFNDMFQTWYAKIYLSFITRFGPIVTQTLSFSPSTYHF